MRRGPLARPAKRGSAPGSLAKVLAASVIALLAAFSIVETGVRLLERGGASRAPAIKAESDDERSMMELSGPKMRRVREGGRIWLEPMPRSAHPGPETSKWPLVKAPGTKRIVVLGESSGDGLAKSARALASSRPEDRIEVLNCADGGASSAVAARRFEECLQYDPDVLVLVLAHNVFRNLPRIVPWISRLNAIARRSRAAARFEDWWRKRRGSAWGMFSQIEALAKADAVIRRMARESHARGIPLILCTVPSNLWFSPAADGPDSVDERYLDALYDYGRGRRESATRKLESLNLTADSPLWHFKLGDWAYRAGDFTRAYRHLSLARDLDSRRRRASSAVNGLLRDEARSRHLGLADMEELVLSRAPHGIPGWESFNDDQHVTSRVFLREAAMLLKLLSERGLLPRGRDWPAEIRSNRFREARRTLPEAWRLLSWDGAKDPAPTFEQIEEWRPALVLFAMRRLDQFNALRPAGAARFIPDRKARAAFDLTFAEAFGRAGRFREAFSALDEADRLKPDWDESFLRRGFLELEEGRLAGAGRSFRMAASLNPGNRKARYFDKRTRGALGQKIRGDLPRK